MIRVGSQRKVFQACFFEAVHHSGHMLPGRILVRPEVDNDLRIALVFLDQQFANLVQGIEFAMEHVLAL
ncbi:MAG: hypothetical protein JWM16_382, partial [Verrucomicrobiales bacterium]|nr:hypothetical protein [Verrucomicrobiales bacterium]